MAGRHHRGFTIVEILVVIGIFAVLTALAVTAARRSAVDAGSLANLRTHAQVATIYTGDFGDHAPFFADPEAVETIIVGGGVALPIEYFDSSWAWAFALTDRYYGTTLWSASGYNWGGSFIMPRGEGLAYHYSPTFITRPAFWNDRTRSVGQLGPTRLAEVRSPDAKAIFVEWDDRRGLPWWRDDALAYHRNYGFAFVDGSARRPDSNSLVRPYPRGEGTAYGGRLSIGVSGLHTLDGILGRDVQ